MDYSAQLSYNQLSKFLDVCLDFYKDGYYSLESVDEKQCTPQKRKSMKNDFKEYFVGTKAKPKTINPKVLCVIEALLDADTSRVIELKRRNRELNNKIKELETEKQNAIKYEVNQIRRELETSIRQELKSEQTDTQMRDTNRMLRYKDIMDKQEKAIKNYKDNFVNRELHDNNIKELYELKLLYEKSQERVKIYEAGEKKEIEKIEQLYKKQIEKIEETHKKQIEKLNEKLAKYSNSESKKKKLEKARQLEIQRQKLLEECGISDDELSD